uniref:Uncharacterized protein n=1 Tax=Paramoeba aestuarina TaxID=180227 RepID=A0A7S4NGR2_9EUKA|mmetsp:Transcript_16275/g.25286  ORF Transcript_16275/g.25286 Transcript_16275/m.25286 type:complete len:135 (+) Transcript_16275:25-429(+)
MKEIIEKHTRFLISNSPCEGESISFLLPLLSAALCDSSPPEEQLDLKIFKEGVYDSQDELDNCQQIFVDGLGFEDDFVTVSQTVVLKTKKNIYFFERYCQPEMTTWKKVIIEIPKRNKSEPERKRKERDRESSN